MGVRVPPSAHFKYKKLKINKKKISNTESSIDIIIENKDYINPFESKLKELKKRVNLKVTLLNYIKFIKIRFICSKNLINSMFLENNLDFMNI